jgi:hypothetical protein
MKIRLLVIFCLIFCSATATFAQETNCTDNIDNDADGLIDCQDPDCPLCADHFDCSEPYIYYLPPLFGSRTLAGYSANYYSAEDIVISTLNRAATVNIKAPVTGTILKTVSVPVANPVNVTIASTDATQVLHGNNELNTVMSNSGYIITSDQPLQVTYRLLASLNQPSSTSRPGCDGTFILCCKPNRYGQSGCWKCI